MIDQTVKHVMGVLPDGFGDNERGFGIDIAEDFHAFLLGTNEAVLLVRLVGMGADDLVAAGFDGTNQGRLHSFLCRPADLVGA